ncbi:hypothetical protein ACWC0C_12955 [Streptomyces sp. NPDC001709]
MIDGWCAGVVTPPLSLVVTVNVPVPMTKVLPMSQAAATLWGTAAGVLVSGGELSGPLESGVITTQLSKPT